MSSDVRREMWRSEDCSTAVSQIAAAATYGHAWQTVDTNMLNNMPLSLKKELGTNFYVFEYFFYYMVPWIHINTS